MTDYSKITNQDFEDILFQLIRDNELTATEMMGMPGVYEIVSEEMNNTILEMWEDQQSIDE